MAIKVSIIGASGYTGQELLRIFLRHKEVEVVTITSRKYKGSTLSDVFPQFRATKYANLRFEEPDINKINEVSDAVFLAVPHGEAMKYVKGLTKRVIDLSADYRLKDKAIYEKWYNVAHEDKSGLAEAVYGLPEIYRDAITDARIIANPGCYPTSILIPLLPLVREGIEFFNIFINSYSGITGAGVNPSAKTHFININENVVPYNVGKHRHTPEITQELKNAGYTKDIVFTPYLIPVDRGIISVINAEVKGLAEANILDIYDKYYGKEKFVYCLPDSFPDLKMVRNTNNCIFGFEILNESSILIISAIDNILKGASGQAVQNMNIMFGIDESRGLDFISFK